MAGRSIGWVHVLLVVLIYVPLLAAGWIAADRYVLERQCPQVGLVLDYPDLQEVVAAQGRSLPEVLPELARRRLMVAVPEDTVGDLVDSGRVSLVSAPPGIGLATPDPALARRLRAQLEVRLQRDLPLPVRSGGTWLLTVNAPRSLLDTVGVGLPPADVLQLANAGVGVVARLRNYRGIAPAAVEFMVAQAAAQGAHAVVFEGEEVVGYPRLVERTAKALLASNLLYGSVEFAKQRGDVTLGRALKGALVRVHSITGPEMGTAQPQDVRERFARAVRERNIRLCYLRAYTGSAGTLNRLLEDCDAIAAGIRHAGGTVGVPTAFPAGPDFSRLRLLLSLPAAAAGVLLLGVIVPLRNRSRLLLLVLGILACAGALLAAPGLGARLVALAAAAIFPGLSLVLLARHLQQVEPPATPRRPVLRGVGMLAAVSLVSLGGALMVAALLSGRLYLVKVDQFLGIKAANLFPLVLLAVVAAGQLYANGLSRREWWAQGRARLAHLAAHPVLVWEVVLALVAMGALALFVARSGNDPGVGVSGVELKVRALLEYYLPARPRTKEFLIGHPALMLAVAMALTGRRRWLIPMLLVAAIGQVSMVNTFCHLHTPLALSLTRTLVGLLAGAVVGVVVVWAWLGIMRALDKRQAAAPAETALR